jgi:hypothetical protein
MIKFTSCADVGLVIMNTIMKQSSFFIGNLSFRTTFGIYAGVGLAPLLLIENMLMP